jgi:hypothetical protein
MAIPLAVVSTHNTDVTGLWGAYMVEVLVHIAIISPVNSIAPRTGANAVHPTEVLVDKTYALADKTAIGELAHLALA